MDQPLANPRRNLPPPIIISQTPTHLDLQDSSQNFTPHSAVSAVSAASSLPLPSPASLTARWSVTQKLFPYFSDWTTAPIAKNSRPDIVESHNPFPYIHEQNPSYILPRQSATRLWNPQNSSPRTFASATFSRHVVEPIKSSGVVGKRDETPLLTTGERRRSRNNLLHASRVDSQIDLHTYPVSHRDSSDYGSDRSSIGLPYTAQKSPGLIQGPNRHTHKNTQATYLAPPATMSLPAVGAAFTPAKGYSKDPERQQPGLDNAMPPSPSRASLPRSSHQDVPRTPTIMTEPTVNEEEYPWGPAHPCFPHMNSHVPLASPLYSSTRIIRVRRDWMQAGDLAPTFANLYPEVLDPLVSEDEFRRVVRHINTALVAAFSPWSVRNWIDSVMGVLTLWLWDDLGLSGIKSELKSLEVWIENWNKIVGLQEGVSIVPLRRTGYLSLDIQIPDPHITLDPLAYGPSRPDTAHDPALHPGFGDPGPYPVPRVPSSNGLSR